MLLLATALLLAGCERGETLGTVHGQVTLDGRPVPQGLVVFSNHDKGVHIMAPIDAEGNFQVQMAQGFGLPLGTYQVAVNPPPLSPPMPGAPPPASLAAAVIIPRQYLQPESSGLSTTILAGDNPYDIAMRSH